MAILDFVNFNGARLDLQDSASVHFDAEQELTDAQQTQARENIAAAGQEDLESFEDYVRQMSPLATVGPADIVSIEDAAPLSVEGLKVNVEPKQDLHGYDAPWPAGGGKNLLQPTTSFPITIAGVTWSVRDDGAIIAQRTASSANNSDLSYVTSTGSPKLTSSKYVFSCFDSESAPGATSYQANVRIDGTSHWGIGRYSFTASDSTTVEVTLRVYQSFSGTAIFKPMLELGSTPTSFAPYSNICPITGWEGVTVKDTGVNVWDEEWEVGGYTTADGTKYADPNRIRTTGSVKCKPSTQYYLVTPTQLKFCYFDKNDTFVEAVVVNADSIFTTPANAYSFAFSTNTTNYGTTYNHDISINYPATDHDYHPYKSRTASASFPETIYGGTVDLATGECVVDRAYVARSASQFQTTSISGRYYTDVGTSGQFASTNENLSNMAVSVLTSVPSSGQFYLQSGFRLQWQTEYESLADLSAAMNGTDFIFCGKLATPIPLTLTPAELELFKGVNNISADAGQVTVTYRQDVFLALNKRINELQALVLES